MRASGVFTGTTNSPSRSPRQSFDRYAIRAGRNLPDKEFRYLRTVIVTAAVHRGFRRELAPPALTFRHWAGVSPYVSAYAFAGTWVFGKQSPGPDVCAPLAGGPLLPKLRGQFAEFLDEGSLVRLGGSPPPTSVGLRYGPAAPPDALFSTVRVVPSALACAEALGPGVGFPTAGPPRYSNPRRDHPNRVPR